MSCYSIRPTTTSALPRLLPDPLLDRIDAIQRADPWAHEDAVDEGGLDGYADSPPLGGAAARLGFAPPRRLLPLGPFFCNRSVAITIRSTRPKSGRVPLTLGRKLQRYSTRPGFGRQTAVTMSRLGVGSVVQNFQIEKFLGKGSYGCARPPQPSRERSSSPVFARRVSRRWAARYHCARRR